MEGLNSIRVTTSNQGLLASDRHEYGRHITVSDFWRLRESSYIRLNATPTIFLRGEEAAAAVFAMSHGACAATSLARGLNRTGEGTAILESLDITTRHYHDGTRRRPSFTTLARDGTDQSQPLRRIVHFAATSRTHTRPRHKA